jgi:ATP-dependent Clp protease ATP-binding subunit ClpC
MFERFTDGARKVMAIANEHVRRFHHQYIGTEHIFLGLVQESGGTGASVLKNLGVDIDNMLPELEQLFKSKGGKDAVAEGNIPQTKNAIKVIEYAIEEARNLNHDYIGTEHILLGLLRVNEGIASQVLANLGVSMENARREIEKLSDRQE